MLFFPPYNLSYFGDDLIFTLSQELGAKNCQCETKTWLKLRGKHLKNSLGLPGLKQPCPSPLRSETQPKFGLIHSKACRGSRHPSMNKSNN
jgi:hypothetical protein